MDKTAEQWTNEANASMERAAQDLGEAPYALSDKARNNIFLAQAQLLAAATAQLVEVTQVLRNGLTRIAETLRTKEA